MKRTLFIFTACAFLLAGCRKVPDEVREQMESKGETGQLELEDCTYCTADELKNLSREDITYVPKNLILPDKIDFSDLEEVGTVTFKSQENYLEKKEEVAAFFGVEVPKWEYYKTKKSSCGYDGEDESILVSDNGYIVYQTGEYYQSTLSQIWPKTVAKVHLNREECPEMELSLGEETLMLTDMVEIADDWLSKCTLLNPDLKYKLRTIYVREDEEQNNRLNLLYQMMYKGVGLSYITYPMDPNSTNVVIKSVYSNILLYMDSGPYVTGMVLSNNVTVEAEEMAEKVIDFESALRLIEKKMAGYSALKVKEVRIEYILEPQYQPEKDEDAYGPGVIMEARPVYSFWIASGGEDDGEVGICEANEMVYINVDMLDGTVTDDFGVYSFRGY